MRSDCPSDVRLPIDFGRLSLMESSVGLGNDTKRASAFYRANESLYNTNINSRHPIKRLVHSMLEHLGTNDEKPDFSCCTLIESNRTERGKKEKNYEFSER